MIYVSARYITPPPYTGTSMVEGMDIDGNTETAQADHSVFRLNDHGPVGFVRPIEEGGVGGTISPYVPPAVEPETVQCPQCNGSGRILL